MWLVALQPKPRAVVLETLLQYIHTDATCCRHEPGALAERQAQVRIDKLAAHSARHMLLSIEWGLHHWCVNRLSI